MHQKRSLTILAACVLQVVAGTASAQATTLRDAAAAPLMVRIPPGTFMMGSRTGEDGREGDEAPRHAVTLPNAFYVSKYEVTEEEWAACVAAAKCAPLQRHLGARYPARMNWPDTLAYTAWLSALTGHTYRALTEAEWEYAARAGTETAYPFGDSITPQDANYVQSRKDAPVAVGSYPANRFGLHDMIGNVWEWVQDCYYPGGYYDARADGQPVARDKCGAHTVRGGSFQIRAAQTRVSYRYRVFKDDGDVGFRVARDVAPALAAAGDGVFHPGQLWPDDKGVHINAHGGGVLLYKGSYYWYGEHKVAGDAGNTAQVGIHVYSSKDLSAWKDGGIALPVSDDTTHDLAKGSIIERPKVIYNAATRKFVMWFHLDFKGLGYKSSRSGVAVADSPLGPFTYLHSFLPDAGVWPVNIRAEEKDPVKFPVARDHDGGQFARDMTLFVDDDGAAYHVYASEDNHTLHISRLSDDYTRPSGKYARVLAGGDNEAPVLFKAHGKYYMITSGLSGWAPNAARCYVADAIFGPWTSLGNPVRGTQAQMDTTFGGQGTHIIAYHGGFIFMADIWRPQNAIDGRYAWLPLGWEDGKPVLRWKDSWRIDEVSGAKLPTGSRN